MKVRLLHEPTMNKQLCRAAVLCVLPALAACADVASDTLETDDALSKKVQLSCSSLSDKATILALNKNGKITLDADVGTARTLKDLKLSFKGYPSLSVVQSSIKAQASYNPVTEAYKGDDKYVIPSGKGCTYNLIAPPKLADNWDVFGAYLQQVCGAKTSTESLSCDITPKTANGGSVVAHFSASDKAYYLKGGWAKASDFEGNDYVIKSRVNDGDLHMFTEENPEGGICYRGKKQAVYEVLDGIVENGVGDYIFDDSEITGTQGKTLTYSYTTTGEGGQATKQVTFPPCK